jgi:hypothetical protein
MDHTEKTLALLLVASIIVSLGGTVVSLNKLGQVQFKTLTARATANTDGYVQLNITSDTSIAFTKSTINFGNGYVNSSCNNCTMWTNSTTGGTSKHLVQSCCEAQWNTLTAGTTKVGLWIRNEGNTNLTVNLDFDKDASTFIGGTGALFQYRTLTDVSSKGCSGCSGVAHDDNANSCKTTLRYTSAWADANTSNPILCANYGFTNNPASDEMVLDVKVGIPRTSPTNAKVATLTITGTSSA